MKEFNTNAVCLPSKHYMVDISERVKEIKKLVDAGKYFTINRARQYGKTTTLNALKNVLKEEYVVVNLSFEGLTAANFSNEYSFVKAFCRMFKKSPVLFKELPDNIKAQFNDYLSRKEEKAEMDELFMTLGEWCSVSEKKIVMLIDEVDQAADNQIFIDFLGLLRNGYISRDFDGIPTFQSVILAGVTDIKHLKNKIRANKDEKENSPWNIAADFLVDMSLQEDGIREMLDDYEKDHNTGMNTSEMAKLIRNETSGYPFLVSRYCQLIDEQLSDRMGLKEAWTKNGFCEARKLLLAENNSLFQSLTGKLNNYPKLKASIRSILMEGTKLTYNAQNSEIAQLQMYGLIKNDNNTVKVANRTFETMLYNLFTTDEELESNVFFRDGSLEKNRFVSGGKLNMEEIFKGFIKTYTQVFGPLKDRFSEKDGRELFLLYLKPIINGTGNYYIEAQTRTQTRTDIIVDYLGVQYVIELKIWRGPGYNEDGENQISEYLDYFGLDTGYMFTFNFNQKKEQGVKWVKFGSKDLLEAML